MSSLSAVDIYSFLYTLRNEGSWQIVAETGGRQDAEWGCPEGTHESSCDDEGGCEYQTQFEDECHNRTLVYFQYLSGVGGAPNTFLNDVQCWNMLPLNHKLQSRFCVIRFLDFTNLILRLSLRYASRRGLWNATSTVWRVSVWIKMANAWTTLKRKPF